ncbi:18870_t:CDS:2 [Gigaspora rosea]|nr:18870_t:CDS:2 [Gigaspora rosea]
MRIVTVATKKKLWNEYKINTVNNFNVKYKRVKRTPWKARKMRRSHAATHGGFTVPDTSLLKILKAKK